MVLVVGMLDILFFVFCCYIVRCVWLLVNGWNFRFSFMLVLVDGCIGVCFGVR